MQRTLAEALSDIARSGAPLALLAILLGGPGLPQTASARPASVGPYAEAGLGATGLLGDASEHARVGPAFALRIGRDLASWLSVGGRLDLSTHQATVPPPPEGEYFQLYGAAAEIRAGFRAGAFALFADGGLGLARISTNVLEKVRILEPGDRVSLTFSGGAGTEYQLQNRHYALGLAAHATVFSRFGDASPLTALTGRLYLRYTY